MLSPVLVQIDGIKLKPAVHQKHTHNLRQFNNIEIRPGNPAHMVMYKFTMFIYCLGVKTEADVSIIRLADIFFRLVHFKHTD